MKTFTTLSFLSLSGLLPAVVAHGRLNTLTINGKVYEGPRTGDTTTPSVIRAINSIEPRMNLKSDDMGCGAGAADETAQLTAEANAGDEMLFDWVNGNQVHNWPHDKGPMITYMADCGGDCSKFKSTDAKWFKIDEAGINPGTGRWFQGDTLFVGKPHSVKLPANIPSGNYLIRHEVIGLHNAQTVNQAEFYPACSQVKVTGTQGSASDLPASDFASFPGAYSPTDPGILVDVFPLKGAYKFPGPDVADFSAAGSGSGNRGSNGNNNSNSDDGEDAQGGASSSPSSTVARASSTATTSVTTITPAPATDDNTDSGEGSSDDGADVVTVTKTVTANPKKATKTVTVTATVTADAEVDAAENVKTATVSITVAATASATPEGGYRRRSRIMGRRVHY